jgi:hypothetical protein
MSAERRLVGMAYWSWRIKRCQMSFVIAAPLALVAAATDLTNIGSTVP